MADTFDIAITVVASEGTEVVIPIYEVELTKQNGTWTEVFGSLLELETFLLGVRAGAEMGGAPLHLREALIPRHFREDWIQARLHEKRFVLWPDPLQQALKEE